MKVHGLFKNALRTHHVPAGAAVFVEGQSGDEMFGVIEGEIELRHGDRAIAKLGPDEVFGEMALIDAAPRMATAIAVTDTDLAVIDKHRFLFLVHETPMFALQVMATMAERSRAQA